MAFPQLQGDLKTGTQGHPLAVGVDIADQFGTVHAHAQAVHDQAIDIDEVVEDPVGDLHRLLQAVGAGHHDRGRPVGGHVVEGLPRPPRQHPGERIDTRDEVVLQWCERLGRTDLAHLARATHRQCQPGLVVVVLVGGQLAQIARGDTPHGVADAVPARLGGASPGGIDQAVKVMGLPPVVPVDKEFFLGVGGPGHIGQVGSGHAPDASGVALVDG